MKKVLTIILSLFTLWNLQAEDTKYEDQPLGLTADMAKLLEPYEKKAKETFHIFEKAFAEKDGSAFYLVTRIYQDDFYEQVFVRIQDRSEDVYSGIIASSPMGKVKFSEGDPIKISKDKIHDWLIVNKDGTEKGNFLGKATDLLQVGRCAFIVEMIPVDGIFENFKVVLVLNAATDQDVIDIAPESIISEAESRIAELHKGGVSEDGKSKFSYVIVKFPEWEIEKPKSEPAGGDKD